jgi:hypothetical protein
LTEKQIRRGVRRFTTQLAAAINIYIKAVNANPKPFVWKSAYDILASTKPVLPSDPQTAAIQNQVGKISELGH